MDSCVSGQEKVVCYFLIQFISGLDMAPGFWVILSRANIFSLHHRPNRSFKLKTRLFVRILKSEIMSSQCVIVNWFYIHSQAIYIVC